MKFRSIGTLAVLSVLAVVTLGAVASSSGEGKPKHIVLIYNGPAVQNTHSTPPTPAFTAWCNSTCSPSVTLPVSDPTTGDPKGTIHVWTKNFHSSADGNTLCFGEFIWYALKDGSIYTDSGDSGTCGAFMDSSLKPATHIPGDRVVGGGGDGTIVGGTHRFARWTGTYTDRVFVEFGAANYYDQLFFSINPN
jgi:hypothetical protein